MSEETSPHRGGATWFSLLIPLIPLVAVVELGLHVKQTTTDVVPQTDWVQARDAIKADVRPDDLVTFAPFWTDPLGRRTFGDGLASMKREGRSDVTRFARAFEVSIRGAHDDALASWKKISERQTGGVTVTLLANPAPVQVIDDLLDFIPDRLAVSRIDAAGESPCAFQHGVSAGGSTVVPQGLLTPADRFVCTGGHAGIAVLHGADHHAHLCLFATPLQGAKLRLRFKDVTFGPELVGHSGVQWMAERNPTPERISVTFHAFDHLLGTHAHKVGAGWTAFDIPTAELDGKKGDLVADIAPSGQRQFCFEATTRRPADIAEARP